MAEQHPDKAGRQRHYESGAASGEHCAADQFAAPQGGRLSQPATDAPVGEGLARLAQLLQGTPPSNPLL